MKLSEAILLGRHLCAATISPKDATNSEGCALTMASLAVGAKSRSGDNLWHEAKIVWPWLELKQGCPFADCYWAAEQDSGYMTIAHVFDAHVMTRKQWSLEQLVDYVRSIEPQEADATPAEQPEVDEAERKHHCTAHRLEVEADERWPEGE